MTILDRSKQIFEVLGAVAAATTVIIALLFGAGYFANQQHDAMIGLITTSSYEAYVRTGALLVPRSIAAIGSWLSAVPSWTLVLGTIIVILAVFLSRYPIFQFRHSIDKTIYIELAFAGSMIAVALSLLYLKDYLSALHPLNSGLLISSEFTDHKVIQDAGKAGWIYRQLSRETGAHELAKYYGRNFFVFLVLTYLCLVLVRGIQQISPPNGLREKVLFHVTRRVILPTFVIILAIIVICLPSVYGVLMISNSAPCAVVHAEGVKRTDDAIDDGRVLSDLDLPDVVIYHAKGQGEYSVEIFKRSNVLTIRGFKCPAGRNILAGRE